MSKKLDKYYVEQTHDNYILVHNSYIFKVIKRRGGETMKLGLMEECFEEASRLNMLDATTPNEEKP